MTICSIDGCGRAVQRRGFCDPHYRRFLKYGDANGGPRSLRGDGLRFLQHVIEHESGDECIVWPFARNLNGYGAAWHRGRQTMAHRLACLLAHGEPPNPSLHAAHSCNNGHGGCVNPRHLRWATPTENMADMLLHGVRPLGEMCGAAKLKTSDVLAIRAACDVSDELLAKQYGVSKLHVRRVKRRQTWGWLAGPDAAKTVPA